MDGFTEMGGLSKMSVCREMDYDIDIGNCTAMGDIIKSYRVGGVK
jgi:hypothetical protein